MFINISVIFIVFATTMFMVNKYYHIYHD